MQRAKTHVLIRSDRAGENERVHGSTIRQCTAGNHGHDSAALWLCRFRLGQLAQCKLGHK